MFISNTNYLTIQLNYFICVISHKFHKNVWLSLNYAWKVFPALSVFTKKNLGANTEPWRSPWSHESLPQGLETHPRSIEAQLCRWDLPYLWAMEAHFRSSPLKSGMKTHHRTNEAQLCHGSSPSSDGGLELQWLTLVQFRLIFAPRSNIETPFSHGGSPHNIRGSPWCIYRVGRSIVD